MDVHTDDFLIEAGNRLGYTDNKERVANKSGFALA